MAPRGSMACSLQLAVLMSAAIALGFGVRAGGAAQLCSEYYDRTCPDVHRVVRRVLKKAHEADVRIYASLTRLHFHDCFVQGCDGSILLDNSSSIVSEKFATPNNNSARGYPVVDAVKAALEEACPGVVSCADILAIAAKISVELKQTTRTVRRGYSHVTSRRLSSLISRTVRGRHQSVSFTCHAYTGHMTRGPVRVLCTQSGGPRWRVPLGRRDGTTANITAANNLPSPFDNLTTLEQKFGAVGLDDTDLVALSGAHTFGRVQCRFVTARLYNFSGTNRPDPTLDRGYRAFLSLRCPRGGNASALNDLDPTTPDTFDNNYYTSIEARRGTLQSDQELLSTPGAPTAPIVGRFAGSQKEFFRSFARSMINMGNIQVLTGSQGEIRKNCRVVNGS